ncbi:hypothetical protein [Polynucleobacter sp. AP-Nino-20-G2]|uniref:hypothetical protein n=1 Tax=Polynucleobacter sp. AP-Nino-20-G2 TaxID=2576917 RepID=UPI001BFDE0AE|nr:hypothetical protein [Polynucleobacter sp. AP-Nino-20-G2]QWE17233.1 hypothetical protein FD960_03170 [Polynucleobacter sp. AP-Nino-20-G2]
MKRIVDIFTKDWASEIAWTYVINLGDEHVALDIDAFENEALRMATDEGKGTPETIFAKVRE